MSAVNQTIGSPSPTLGGIDPLDDRLEQLGTDLLQLRALLAVCYGEGGESFRCYSDEIQDAYLWACFAKADECYSRLQDLQKPTSKGNAI